MSRTDEEETDKKKKKQPGYRNFTRCRQPMCADKILVNENTDADLEIAKHNKSKHDIPYPKWVEIVWDGLEKYNKKPKKDYSKKYDGDKKSY